MLKLKKEFQRSSIELKEDPLLKQIPTKPSSKFNDLALSVSRRIAQSFESFSVFIGKKDEKRRSKKDLEEKFGEANAPLLSEYYRKNILIIKKGAAVAVKNEAASKTEAAVPPKQESNKQDSKDQKRVDISETSISVDTKEKGDHAVMLMKREQYIEGLMNGKIRLSKDFRSKYQLGDQLGDGAFGFVITANKIDDNTEVTFANVQVAIKFIEAKKIPADNMVKTAEGEMIPFEIKVLQDLKHPNIIKIVEWRKEHNYILLITELHGSSWDLSNSQINPVKNPGLKFATTRTKKTSAEPLRRRTSCDLFECIEAHHSIDERTARYIFAQIVFA